MIVIPSNRNDCIEIKDTFIRGGDTITIQALQRTCMHYSRSQFSYVRIYCARITSPLFRGSTIKLTSELRTIDLKSQ